ncbi:MFS general substrate transporter [Basidiobolus meristosporus CBS 931.73]|uniref:MFS general substrate transporter n=1 Tax=Basidiobolus meristosporus CBS 931.73 TaxID=1314790 RepID=A0A1Y1XTL2_9FUNG|nr:MFS general substrate transporter [Basidiobolus meristosporus CBS 931.73]|eukprot:ORX89109.1 MFS general substrate transporter [Basidiobolus meristosporus CBS 931.73]
MLLPHTDFDSLTHAGLDLLQGIPVGLTLGSIPFLLKSKMSYSQIGIFSLAGYPYSLKLLWSPFVDSIYSKTIGRRKTWIVPIQLITSAMFFWLGANIDGLMNDDEVKVYGLTAIFFSLILLCATQDIAVDGWALTLLSKENLSYASTSQTIGLNTGYFLSFTVFLALNSPEFCNKYIRTIPEDVGAISLGGYFTFWAAMYLVVTLWLIVVKKEEPSHEENDEHTDVKSVYRTMISICSLPHMKRFLAILLIAKIGFIANDAVTGLKLLEKGFNKEDLALAVLIDFPFQIVFGYYAAKWSNGPRPLKPWLYAFYMRLVFASIGMWIVYIFPSEGVTNSYLAVVITSTVLSSFASTVQFVSISAFITSISDPAIGGTYMTLLNTISNLGGTWPKFFVLEAVDYFTEATCTLPDNTTFSCVAEVAKEQCTKQLGTCATSVDGYYLVSTLSVVIGAALLFGYIIRQIRSIEALPASMWRLKDAKSM